MKLPELYPVRQKLRTTTVSAVAETVRSGFAELAIPRHALDGKRIAVTVGSRGIANVPVIVRATVAALRDRGAKPFLVPAMGSHGGATATGQRQVLAELGVTSASAGCPLKASMRTIELGRVEDNLPVHLDAHAAASDGILVLNRVKPHTAFSGPYESGLLKMLSVGLGKQRGAEALHNKGLLALRERVPAAGKLVLERAPILAAVAILENGLHQTAKIAVLPAADILTEEPRLLRSAKSLMPRFPFKDVDVLIVDQIGKNIAGSGMDLKLLGRAPGIRTRFPKIRYIVVLSLSPESHGNAMGIGAADFTTSRLVEAIDREATQMNALTANAPARAKLPVYFPTDREAIEAALQSVRDKPLDAIRVARLRNTLELECTFASPALLDEVNSAPMLSVEGAAVRMRFDGKGRLV